MDVYELRRRILNRYEQLDSYLDHGSVEERIYFVPDDPLIHRAEFLTIFLAPGSILFSCVTDDDSTRIFRLDEECYIKFDNTLRCPKVNLSEAIAAASRSAYFAPQKVPALLLANVPGPRLMDISGLEYIDDETVFDEQCHHLKAVGFWRKDAPQELDLWVSAEDLVLRRIEERFIFDPYAFVDVESKPKLKPIRAKFKHMLDDLMHSEDLLDEIPWMANLALSLDQATTPFPVVRTTSYKDVFLDCKDVVTPVFYDLLETMDLGDEVQRLQILNKWRAA